ncbi:MAG: sugar phosphate isomerase/epimerase [Bacteroidales bacterium]|jgi:sugar phosphate isomerase/epimerase|nr:sugar phosphate isomerase/epimerase [Bacteroidales bacterium]
MLDRRKFLKTTAAVAAGSFFTPTVFSCGKSAKVIGIQLYTVREKLNADLTGTLQALADIGYNSFEAAGYNASDRTFYGMAPEAFAKLVKDMGAPLNSSHTTFEPDSAQTVCEDAAKAGIKYIIYPYLPDTLRTNLDDYKKTADKFNKMGEVAKSFGLKFGYHNHNFEFDKMDGQIPFDLLLAETDPALVTYELDLYWIIRAGYQPTDYFKKYPGRFELWHVKDMVKEDDQFFAPVGTGRIDFASIFAEQKTSGLKMIFVEQDNFRNLDSLESAEISFDYLSKAPFWK